MNSVEIEATNLCNARCAMCPREAITRPKGLMSWELFRAVADKFLTYGQTRTFSFSGIGEPLLNPHLSRFVAYVSGHAETYLTTNGALLSEPVIEGLLEAGLDTLILSLNGAEPGLYEAVMPPLRFEQTEAAVRLLVERAKGRMQLLANVTVSRLTRGQLPAIARFVRELGMDQAIYSLCHSRGGHYLDPAVFDYLPPPPSTRCDIFEHTTFVAWNGQVLACCQDLAGEAVLGDLAEMPIEALAQRRSQVLEKGVAFPMCPDCDDINRVGYDEPPGGISLSEWVYRLYESHDSRTTVLADALRNTEGRLAQCRTQLSALQDQNAQARARLDAYERGRFMRAMAWLSRLRRRLAPRRPDRSPHPGGQARP